MTVFLLYSLPNIAFWILLYLARRVLQPRTINFLQLIWFVSFALYLMFRVPALFIGVQVVLDVLLIIALFRPRLPLG